MPIQTVSDFDRFPTIAVWGMAVVRSLGQSQRHGGGCRTSYSLLLLNLKIALFPFLLALPGDSWGEGPTGRSENLHFPAPVAFAVNWLAKRAGWGPRASLGGVVVMVLRGTRVQSLPWCVVYEPRCFEVPCRCLASDSLLSSNGRN